MYMYCNTMLIKTLIVVRFRENTARAAPTVAGPPPARLGYLSKFKVLAEKAML